MITRWLTIVLCMFGASLPARGRDIYVNNLTGNDIAVGALPDAGDGAQGPVRTLAKALRLAEAGDRVVLANTGEPYRESVTLQGGRHSGNGVMPFILDGNGATLDGVGEIPRGAWEVVDDDIYRFRPYRLVHQQVFLGERCLQRRIAETGDGWRDLLDENTWSLYLGRIYVRVPVGKTVHELGYTHSNLRAGLTLYRVHDLAITNLVVRGYQLDGISLPEGVRNCALVDVECRHNGRAGIALDGASRCELVRCRASGNGEAELITDGRSRVERIDTAAVPARSRK